MMRPMDWDDSHDVVPVQLPGTLRARRVTIEELRAVGLTDEARVMQERMVRRLIKQGWRAFRAYDPKRGRIVFVAEIIKRTDTARCGTLKGKTYIVPLADLHVYSPK